MATVKFTDYNIYNNSVKLIFTHEGVVFNTNHEKEISIDKARKLIEVLKEKVEKQDSFSMDYDGHTIKIKSSLAKKCIADFEKKH